MSRGRHRFRHGGGEGDHIVPRVSSISKMRGTSKAAWRAQQRGVFARHHPQFRQRLRSGQFDFQPLLKLISIAPDRAHFAGACNGESIRKNLGLPFLFGDHQARREAALLQ